MATIHGHEAGNGGYSQGHAYGSRRRLSYSELIVLSERHLRSVLQEWVAHYNQGRPHASLGPGIPDLPLDGLARPNPHQIPDGHRVIATPSLAGLHHEYRFEPLAAQTVGRMSPHLVIAEHRRVRSDL